MIFIDGTWLWHNMMSVSSASGLKVDLAKLPVTLISELSRVLKTTIVPTNTVLCASVPINTHPHDIKSISKRRHFFEVLRDKCGYNIELFEIDFHGRRLLKQDRDPADSWEPKEKCVDIATATNILLYSSYYDIALVVTGDKDFLPALNKVKILGKQVHIASFQKSCSTELIDFCPNIIWLDNLIDSMILIT